MIDTNPKSVDEIPLAERATVSQHDHRMSICNACDRISLLKFCKECHCFMPVKTYLSFAKCPLGKW